MKCLVMWHLDNYVKYIYQRPIPFGSKDILYKELFASMIFALSTFAEFLPHFKLTQKQLFLLTMRVKIKRQIFPCMWLPW